MARLQEDITKSEIKAEKYFLSLLIIKKFRVKAEASAALKRGDKKSALASMKRFKLLEKEIDNKDSQYQNLFQMLQNISQSKQNREILNIYQSSTKAFKNTLSRERLTVDNVIF